MALAYTTPKDKAIKICHRLWKKKDIGWKTSAAITTTIARLMIDEAKFLKNTKMEDYWEEVKKEAKNL